MARGRLAPDADLDLALALDEARAGQIDSAAVRLAGPTLTAAGLDTLPVERYQHYGPEADPLYLTGSFEGWHWYIWRARAEVAMTRRKWEDATVAARRCVAARPFTGKEWLLLAVCAGQAGHAEEARAAAQQAETLDGSLPEAHYLKGMWAWRDGQKAEAQRAFRAAVASDSTFYPGVVALVRSRLPVAAPDTLPTRFLTGAREAGILTSPVGPKIEQFVQLESAAILGHKEDPFLSDSLKQELRNVKLPIWLLVDETGRVVLNDLAWAPPGRFPASMISDLTARLAHWTFLAPKIHGEPRAAWIDILYSFAR
jgi:tetratricopeptide (TPR) repeat protein